MAKFKVLHLHLTGQAEWHQQNTGNGDTSQAEFWICDLPMTRQTLTHRRQKFGDILTNPREESPSWEADCFSPSQEINVFIKARRLSLS